MQILTKQDFIEMPWKNGAGVTTELFRILNPHNNAFYFRLSMASVESDGPFSLFPNIDRILMLIEGRGFKLDGLNTSLTDDKTPLYFQGEVPVNCTLIDGACRDFNVMTDRGFAKSTISVVTLAQGESINLKAECDFKFIYDKKEEKLYKLELDEQYTIEGVTTLLIVDVTKI